MRKMSCSFDAKGSKTVTVLLKNRLIFVKKKYQYIHPQTEESKCKGQTLPLRSILCIVNKVLDLRIQTILMLRNVNNALDLRM